MKRFTNFAMLALCGILFGAPTANAADAQPVGTFNDWRAYVEGSGQTKLCYIVGEPRRKLPRAARAGMFSLPYRIGRARACAMR